MDKNKSTTTITINSEEEDDWMKSLPGYKDEVRLHEELRNKIKRDKRSDQSS